MRPKLSIVGVITKNTGNDIIKDKVLELLYENGYSFNGSLEDITKEKLNSDLNIIVEDIKTTRCFEILTTILEQEECLLTLESKEEFLKSNYETGTFDDIIKRVLRGKSLSIYTKYTELHWTISDLFNSELADKLVTVLKGENCTLN